MTKLCTLLRELLAWARALVKKPAPPVKKPRPSPVLVGSQLNASPLNLASPENPAPRADTDKQQ